MQKTIRAERAGAVNDDGRRRIVDCCLPVFVRVRPCPGGGEDTGGDDVVAVA